MEKKLVLTIVIPIYNMESCLEKNLSTYVDERIKGYVEILCINNSSEDSSAAIAQSFCNREPILFRLINKENNGYGSSINVGIREAKGKYFKIVDADDWVNTEELIRFVDYLLENDSDVIITDYTRVSFLTGTGVLIRASNIGDIYNEPLNTLNIPRKTLPSMHAIAYRTEIIKDFCLQENLFFVDEEYVVMPFTRVKKVLYAPFNVYQYQLENPSQSTSPQNRAKYYSHREKVLKHMIEEYKRECQEGDVSEEAMEYCKERICRGVGDHFTTLYMYIAKRSFGRKLAKVWKHYLATECPEFWAANRKKAAILCLLNLLRISLREYECLKSVIKLGFKNKG